MKKSFTPFELFAIAIFKANRNKGRIKKGIQNGKNSVKKISSIVASINLEDDLSKKEALNQLIEMPGIGIPMASALLSVAYPDNFTIVDYRTIDGLKDFFEIGFPSTLDPRSNIDGYFLYIHECRKKSVELKISLRKLDQMLWGYSFFKDLEKYVKDLN